MQFHLIIQPPPFCALYAPVACEKLTNITGKSTKRAHVSFTTHTYTHICSPPLSLHRHRAEFELHSFIYLLLFPRFCLLRALEGFRYVSNTINANEVLLCAPQYSYVHAWLVAGAAVMCGRNKKIKTDRMKRNAIKIRTISTAKSE